MSEQEKLVAEAWNRNRPDHVREATKAGGIHYLRVERWLYRIGNSQRPDRYDTVIQVRGTPEMGEAEGAYIAFDRNPNAARAPSYHPGTRMLHVNYGFDQLAQVREILDALAERPVWLVYFEYESGHRWAELFHDWVRAP